MALSSLNSLSTSKSRIANVLMNATIAAKIDVLVSWSLSAAKKIAKPHKKLRNRFWNSLSNIQILRCRISTTTAAVHPAQIIPTASQKPGQKSDIPQQRYCWYVHIEETAAITATINVKYQEPLRIALRLYFSIFTKSNLSSNKRFEPLFQTATVLFSINRIRSEKFVKIGDSTPKLQHLPTKPIYEWFQRWCYRKPWENIHPKLEMAWECRGAQAMLPL